MGTNGTVEERLAEADEAGDVLGAVVAREPAAAGPRLRTDRRTRARRREPHPAGPAARRGHPYGRDRHPDHVAANRLLIEAVFNAGLRRYEADGEPWRPEWVCAYFINDAAPASFVVDVSAHYETKRRALACYRSQFQPTEAGAAPTRLTAPTFRQLIESRDAQFGAIAGVAFAEGIVVRDPPLRAHLLRDETRRARRP